MLRTITTEFASTAQGGEDIGAAGAEPGADELPGPRSASAHHGESALERAWKELGSLRPDEPGGLDRILAGASSSNNAARQVAARLLVDADADAEVAAETWGRLLGDPSRGVRRATVDAMVDGARPALRPLLERALHDADAWTRWKALRGLVDLGVEPSRAAVVPLADDPDFRVRLEATRALPDLEAG
jgi:HEAT repeat protein